MVFFIVLKVSVLVEVEVESLHTTTTVILVWVVLGVTFAEFKQGCPSEQQEPGRLIGLQHPKCQRIVIAGPRHALVFFFGCAHVLC